MEKFQNIEYALTISMASGVPYSKIISILRRNNFRLFESANLIKKRYPSAVWPSSFTIKTNLDKIRDKKISFLTIDSDLYPRSLKETDSPPIILYYLGNIELLKNLNQKSIAIVGSRNPTKYGELMAKNFSQELSTRGYTVVSGMAMGIDRIVHINSIKNTIAVLGSGIDIIYPNTNNDLYYNILKNNSLILSEFHISTPPIAYNFPKRNRIIAGLTNATLIIEAKKKSGSLITARIASSYNKDVFAVPGSVGKDESSGCNFLIKNNIAQLVESVDDVVDYMDTFKEADIFDYSSNQDLSLGEFDKNNFNENEESEILKNSMNKSREKINITDENEKIVFDAIEINPLTVEEIFKKTKLDDIKDVRIAIINLQIMNLIDINVDGKYFLNSEY